jgi:hypothetical protein
MVVRELEEAAVNRADVGLGVVYASPDQPARQLPGGKQQRVVLARAILKPIELAAVVRRLISSGVLMGGRVRGESRPAFPGARAAPGMWRLARGRAGHTSPKEAKAGLGSQTPVCLTPKAVPTCARLLGTPHAPDAHQTHDDEKVALSRAAHGIAATGGRHARGGVPRPEGRTMTST